jgi:magnesium transporter
MKKRRKNREREARGQTEKQGPPMHASAPAEEQKPEPVRIEIMNYSLQHLEEIPNAGLDDCVRLKNSPGITWININGISDTRLIQTVAGLFSLHPLTSEDIAVANQRPKAEEFEHYIFFALKMLTYDAKTNAIENENVSVVLGENYVISFQEHEGDVLDPLRARIRSGKGRLRGAGADYLAYAIMDGVVDEYFVVLEKLGDHIEEIDEQILAEPDAGLMKELHRLKREVLFLRKIIWPLREQIAAIEKNGSRLFGDSTRPFLRDLYDHTIEIIDMVETSRDIVGGMHDTFLSSISNRMNEVMKVLTIIGTIFIPLTFIAGIYGMNFDHMPELKWSWGYYGILAFMAALALGMLAIFKKRKWL